MAARTEIISYLDELLDSPGFPDYSPNGLQVPGRSEVTSVVTGVSATLELFELAKEQGAGLVLAHHGIFWGESGALSSQQANRLKILLANDINLAAYHLPLDAHAEHGNNALLIEALGLQLGDPFGDFKGRQIGFMAQAPGGIGHAELQQRIAETLGRTPLQFAFGPETVERIAVVTGSAPDYLQEAVDAGAQASSLASPPNA